MGQSDSEREEETWTSALMNDPDVALKNAVFEYLLATNNVKSAETFFKESNLESQYSVSVDVVMHNSKSLGNTCLICKLFNNWYSFAQNQRSLTQQNSILQKDENMVMMQQFLEVYNNSQDKEKASTEPPPKDADKDSTASSHVDLTMDPDEQTKPAPLTFASSVPPPIPSPAPSSTTPSVPSPTPNSSSPPPCSHVPHKHHIHTIHTTAVTTEIHNCHDQNCSFLQNITESLKPPTIDTPFSPKTFSPATTTNNSTNITNNVTTIHNVNNNITKNKSKTTTNNNNTTNINLNAFTNVNTTNNNTTNNATNTTNTTNNTTNNFNVRTSPLSPSVLSITNTPSTTRRADAPETTNKDNDYLFSVEQKLFSQFSGPPSQHATDPSIHSDALLHLLTLDTLTFPPSSPGTYTSPASPLSSSPSIPPTPLNEDAEEPPDADVDMTIEVNKAGRFCCPFPDCTKSFSTSAILKRHIKEHSGDRPFRCTYEGCGKGFARNYDLKVHMRSHTGEKPYKCTFMGCERTFSRSSDLRLHERIHKGEKPFVCDCAGCQKRFVRYADLKKHKRTHEVHEGLHPHVHGVGCGHTAIAHEDHIDYLHDAHMHNNHKGHIDDHKIGLTDSNPIACTHPHSTFSCDPTHVHNETCGHELVPHYDHYDYLVDGHLHFVHDSHCDDHGWIDVVNWNPSDFPLEGAPPPEQSL